MATYGGDSNYCAASASMTQSVSSHASVVLTSAQNPQQGPGLVTLFAKINITGEKPYGSVYFTWVRNGVSDSSSWMTVDFATQTATYTGGLNPGTYRIQAHWCCDSGSNQYDSNFITQVMSAMMPSAAALTSSQNPSLQDHAVTFTATVTGNAGPTPVGEVSFTEGDRELGAASLSGGTATFFVPALSPGSHTIVAHYGGDETYASSISAALNQTVGAVSMPTTTTLSSSRNPAGAGEAITFTAIVDGGGGPTPSGTVVLTDDGNTFAVVPLDATGRAAANRTFSAGAHTIAAIYGGDANYAGSTSIIVQTASGPSRRRAARH